MPSFGAQGLFRIRSFWLRARLTLSSLSGSQDSNLKKLQIIVDSNHQSSVISRQSSFISLQSSVINYRLGSILTHSDLEEFQPAQRSCIPSWERSCSLPCRFFGSDEYRSTWQYSARDTDRCGVIDEVVRNEMSDRSWRCFAWVWLWVGTQGLSTEMADGGKGGRVQGIRYWFFWIYKPAMVMTLLH